MSTESLDSLLHPKSVAVIGASNRPSSIGAVVTCNIVQGGFEGGIFPINPRETIISGLEVYNDIKSLPKIPDLAVICTPAATVPKIIDELGVLGTRAVIMLTAGLSRGTDEQGRSLQSIVLEHSRAHQMRILGPNCFGVIVPGSRLNASFAHIDALPGKIAFVAQSGALCASVLDWSRASQVGFSYFVSVGDLGDIDFGDMLDYLGSDEHTSAILLYIESIGEGRAREFMSAARAAARNKPVLIVKSGRAVEGQRAAWSHTGALAGSDAVYDAAFRRAGTLRVHEIRELFDASETLSRARPYRGDRLAIVTNGGGPGVLATDALMSRDGRLAQLTPETLSRLNEVLPPIWSHGNPVDLIGDALGERYTSAIEIIATDPGVDAFLVLNVPTAIASSQDAAGCVVRAAQAVSTPIFTCWLGQAHAEPARLILQNSGLPTYATPDDAVRAFMHIVDFHRNQTALMQTPRSAPESFVPRIEEVRQIISSRLHDGVTALGEIDAKAILAAYGVPIVETRIADSVESALRSADQIGYPVALKVLSKQITHKTDVGGVALNLDSSESLRRAIEDMRARISKVMPDAAIDGFSVQKMVRRPRAHELIVGITRDPIFGPAIVFGQGGTATELIGDTAVALPPLNLALAADLVSRTRVSKLLAGYRNTPATALDALYLTLVKVAQLATDHAELMELDINPLLADMDGVVALDARIRLESATAPAPYHLAIRPYPQELEEFVSLQDGQNLLLRPIRPEDRPAHETFIARLTPEDLRSRFFSTVRELPHSQMARLTQIDYDREMAFIAVRPGPEGTEETLGVVRAIADPDNRLAEFAIVIRSDVHSLGLGYALMQKIIRYCRHRGTRELVSDVLPQNHTMLQMARELDFELQENQKDRLIRLRLSLNEEPARALNTQV